MSLWQFNQWLAGFNEAQGSEDNRKLTEEEFFEVIEEVSDSQLADIMGGDLMTMDEIEKVQQMSEAERIKFFENR